LYLQLTHPDLAIESAYLGGVVQKTPNMFDDYNFADELMPSERLEIVLNNIELDMQSGKMPAACEALKEINASQMSKYPTLQNKYDELKQYCLN
jgi:hypothetical protein